MNWTSNDIERLKNKGLTVKLSSPLSKDRTVEVISNGKKETVRMRKAMTHEESQLQQNCVKAFRLIYPRLKMRLYHIPNVTSAKPSAEQSARRAAEGILPGVLDLALDIPNGKYGGMKIEIKTSTGRLSSYQIQFIKEMREDYYCVVIRSVEQFLKEVNDYLKK